MLPTKLVLMHGFAMWLADLCSWLQIEVPAGCPAVFKARILHPVFELSVHPLGEWQP